MIRFDFAFRDNVCKVDPNIARGINVVNHAPGVVVHSSSKSGVAQACF